MRRKDFAKTLVILTLLFAPLLSGCGGSPSAIVFEEAAQTQKPTITITLTPTHHVTATESKAIALNLLKNNGDCRLPCIWGLTPGITTTAERQNILASYGKFSEPDFSMSGSDASKNPGGLGIGVTKDDVRISMGLSYYENENHIEILSLVAYVQREQKYIYGDSNFLDLIEYYTLPQLLSNYGLPSDVLVIAFPHDPFLKADYEPFSIVVIYSNLGIMAEYISPTHRVDDKSRGCPGESHLTLRTWDVKKNISIKKIASIAAGEGMSATAYDYFVPIQDATSMSINDFYNTFKEPNNNHCLEVPSNLWVP